MHRPGHRANDQLSALICHLWNLAVSRGAAARFPVRNDLLKAEAASGKRRYEAKPAVVSITLGIYIQSAILRNVNLPGNKIILYKWIYWEILTFFHLIFQFFFSQIRGTITVIRTVHFPFLVLLYKIYHSAKILPLSPNLFLQCVRSVLQLLLCLTSSDISFQLPKKPKRSRSRKKVCAPCKISHEKKCKSPGGGVPIKPEDLPQHSKYFTQKSTSAAIKSVVALCTLIPFINQNPLQPKSFTRP